ncbi:hypothetical protein HYFRA_00004110 [Hymenoscyphus fraxineus]|uniref:Single-strand DNA deaminase toxin A-like C-terminal domain-containing protein n=1 Tax=Hymenoscyphus fraxineus TaxID=746836 RepID=A0A9N9KPN0_9HELO|nr:hypothetical protein HYFRA_00004110 [Hymenoscyphus fraxineus]
MSREGTIPDASVLWWDSSNFCIQCPFCEKLHHHQPDNLLLAGTTKVKTRHSFLETSGCLPRKFYRCVFPFGEDGGRVAYEIDKRLARFVTAFPSPERDYGLVDDLVSQFAKKASISSVKGSGSDEIAIDFPPTALNIKDYTFKRVAFGLPSIILRAPVANYPIPNEWKTIALLERGQPFPSIMAMSGWSHVETKARIGGDWTYDVMEIAKLVRHELAEDSARDRGEPGRFNASHAEKQLTAYFINRHVFLPQEKQHYIQEESLVVDIDNRLETILRNSTKVQELQKLEQTWKRLVHELRKLEGSWTRLIAELRRMDKKWERQALGLADAEIEARILQNKRTIQKLEADIKTVQTELWRVLVAPPEDMPELEKHAEVREFRKLQRELREIKKKLDSHQKLVDLSKYAPQVSLTSAAILISSPGAKVCLDCTSFVEKVNGYFGLSLEYHECTEK